MFIIACVVCVVCIIIATCMFNECTRERINNDRLRYVSLSANERQIAQKYDARLMSRRVMNTHRHD